MLKWSKGDRFELNNRTFTVKDIDFDDYYQTSFTRTYLKFDRYVKDRWVEHWVDSDLVLKQAKEGKNGKKN